MGVFLPTLSDSQPEGKESNAFATRATVIRTPICSAPNITLRAAYKGKSVLLTLEPKKKIAKIEKLMIMKDLFDSNLTISC